MDDDSDDDVVYRRKNHSSKRDSSNSRVSLSDDEDEDDAELLEIKPPQAKLMRHSSSHYRHSDRSSSRKVYVSSSNHRHKSRHSRKHHDDRYFKERPAETEMLKSSRLSYKEYELTRSKEYDEYKRRQQVHERHSRKEEKIKEEKYKAYEEDYRSENRYTEDDLRERIERRKHHHHRHHRHHRHQQLDYEKHEKLSKEHSSKKYASPKETLREVADRRKRHYEADEKRRDRGSAAHKHSRHEKSEESRYLSAEKQREIVIDVEVSPPVYKEDSEHNSDDTDNEEGNETEPREQKENSGEESSSDSSESSNSNDENGSSSSSSSSSSDDSSSSSSSNSSEEVQEVETEVKSETKEVEVEEEEELEEEELEEEFEREETPPIAVATNDDVDNEIELEKDTLPSYFPAIQGCRSVEEFLVLNRIEEGTYGVVYRAKEKKTDKVVALKRLKMEKEKDGFPITSLREINTLLKAQHPNIVTVKEIVVGSNMDRIFIVMDYVEHDLKSLMETMKKKKSSFVVCEVKCLMQQLLRAVSHLHDNWILHRDLKTSNLLFSNDGVLKVGDFGLAREYGSPLKQYTPVVVTLWYRAPELLLGSKEYSTSIDMWSVGCIFAEFLAMEPLFPGKTEIDQIHRIFKGLGTPNEKIWPDFPKLPAIQKASFPIFPANALRSKFQFNVLSKIGYELLLGFLTYDPKTRMTAENALNHKYFDESPLPIEPAMFPTWPSKSDPV